MPRNILPRHFLSWLTLLLSLTLLGIVIGMLVPMWTTVKVGSKEHLTKLLRSDTVAIHPPEQLPSEIPYILLQTYNDLRKIPAKVYRNLREYAPEYTHQLYDDQSAEQFLSEYFDPAVRDTFRRLQKGAHKADLLRYCLLYVYGGVYMDIKTVLVRPLHEVIHDPTRRGVTLYLVYDYHNTRTYFTEPRIYNGIIASVPRNPFFLQLIHNIVSTRFILYYHIFIRQCYLMLKEQLPEQSIELGKILKGPTNTVYLFHQDCSTESDKCPDGLDRYKLCCHVYDQDRIVFKVRYSDFPW